MKTMVALSFLLFGLNLRATELVELPIRALEPVRTAEGIQVAVTMTFDPCRFTYRGLFRVFEGTQRVRIVALANPRREATCNDAPVPRTDVMIFAGPTSERLEFLR